MQDVVDIVVPLGRVGSRVPIPPPHQARGLVPLVLEDEVHGPVRHGRSHALRKLIKQMHRAVVQDGVHGVKPEPIEVELLDPVERVVDHEVAHRSACRAGEVDGCAPGCPVPVGEEGGRDRVQVIPLGAEMVVDNVEDDHQAARMRRVHQRLHVVWLPVASIRRVGQHPIVAPVPAARKLGDGHELYCRDAERDEVVEPADRGAESAFRREGPKMQFVDHRLLPRPAAP
jgi:hypothetical protein